MLWPPQCLFSYILQWSSWSNYFFKKYWWPSSEFPWVCGHFAGPTDSGFLYSRVQKRLSVSSDQQSNRIHEGIMFTVVGHIVKVTILMHVADEQLKKKHPLGKTHLAWTGNVPASMRWPLYMISRISTGDNTSEVLLGTSSRQQRTRL